jgi:GNAT superfamily N-acetyltransferase
LGPHPMDRARILAEYDDQMRRHTPVEPGTTIDRSGNLVRLVGARSCILYTELTSSTAPAIVEREATRFRAAKNEVEWKLYGHDRPPELGRLLREAGFQADPEETLMVFDLQGETPAAVPPEGVHIERVVDPASLEEAATLSARAFAPSAGWEIEEFRPRIGDPTFAAYIARVDGAAVAAGRLELPPDRLFASLWGGGTEPGHRGQGIYRALVGARAQLARERGYRYLTVDARDTSRPILARVGFEPLASVVGWVLRV